MNMMPMDLYKLFLKMETDDKWLFLGVRGRQAKFPHLHIYISMGTGITTSRLEIAQTAPVVHVVRVSHSWVLIVSAFPIRNRPRKTSHELTWWTNMFTISSQYKSTLSTLYWNNQGGQKQVVSFANGRLSGLQFRPLMMFLVIVTPLCCSPACSIESNRAEHANTTNLQY